MTRVDMMKEAINQYFEVYRRNQGKDNFEWVMDNATFALSRSFDNIMRPVIPPPNKQEITRKNRRMAAIRKARKAWLDELKPVDEYMLSLARDGVGCNEIADATGFSRSYIRNVIRMPGSAIIADDPEAKEDFLNEFLEGNDEFDTLARKHNLNTYYAKKILYIDLWDHVVNRLKP
jgi:hypothetical protein